MGQFRPWFTLTLVASLCTFFLPGVSAGSSPVRKFQEWLFAGGANTSAVRIDTSPEGRRGLFATDPLVTGDLVLRIPYSLILSESPLQAHLVSLCGDDVAPRMTKFLAANFRMAATLLFERALGDDSVFQPMIGQLPQDFDTPTWWPQDDIELLRGSAIYSKVIASRDLIDRVYGRFVERCSSYGSRFPLADWRWAVQAIGSRVFELKTKKHRGDGDGKIVGMVPFADMANHHEKANTTWGFDDESDAFQVFATADIPAGEEVYDSYGVKKDAMLLLMSYGFGIIPTSSDDDDADANSRDSGPQLFTQAFIELPLCLPPSLANRPSSSARQRLLQMQPLPNCCDSQKLRAGNASSATNDETCFTQYLRAGNANSSLFYGIGKPAIGSRETEWTSLARVLAHFRVLAAEEQELTCLAGEVPASAAPAASFAEWHALCREKDCWPDKTTRECVGRYCPQLQPISVATELEALRLLKALVGAHVKQDTVPSAPTPQDDSYRRKLIWSYKRAEQNTLRWHALLADYAMPLLQLKSAEALQTRVCDLASTQDTESRRTLRSFASYIDSVVAPLLFLPYPQQGTPCGVVDTNHGVTEACLKEQLSDGVEDMVAKFRREHGYSDEGGTEEL